MRAFVDLIVAGLRLMGKQLPESAETLLTLTALYEFLWSKNIYRLNAQKRFTKLCAVLPLSVSVDACTESFST